MQAAWRKFCGRLAAHGVERLPQEGPRDYTERAAERLPGASDPIRRIGALYVELRYGRLRNPAGISELAQRVRALRLA